MLATLSFKPLIEPKRVEEDMGLFKQVNDSKISYIIKG